MKRRHESLQQFIDEKSAFQEEKAQLLKKLENAKVFLDHTIQTNKQLESDVASYHNVFRDQLRNKSKLEQQLAKVRFLFILIL